MKNDRQNVTETQLGMVREDERGSASVIVLLVIILVIAGVWFGVVEFKGLPKQLTPPEKPETPATVSDNNSVKENAAVPGAQNQTVNINISGDTNAPVKAAAPDADKSDEETKKSELAKKEKLTIAHDPKNPNPMLAWSDEDKVKAPVRYYTAVLDYLKQQRYNVQRDRFTIGKQSKIFENKLKAAKDEVVGNLAMLRKAVKIAIDAEKTNAWPVNFAYRSYSRDEFKLKICELKKQYMVSRIRAVRMENFSQAMKDRLRLHDQQLERFENDIAVISDNIEMIRSGKLTDITKDRIRQLDEALAENRHNLDETMRQAEKDVNRPVVLEQAEAEGSYEDILKEYAPGRK